MTYYGDWSGGGDGYCNKTQSTRNCHAPPPLLEKSTDEMIADRCHFVHRSLISQRPYHCYSSDNQQSVYSSYAYSYRAVLVAFRMVALLETFSIGKYLHYVRQSSIAHSLYSVVLYVISALTTLLRFNRMLFFFRKSLEVLLLCLKKIMLYISEFQCKE